MYPLEKPELLNGKVVRILTEKDDGKLVDRGVFTIAHLSFGWAAVQNTPGRYEVIDLKLAKGARWGVSGIIPGGVNELAELYDKAMTG